MDKIGENVYGKIKFSLSELEESFINALKVNTYKDWTIKSSITYDSKNHSANISYYAVQQEYSDNILNYLNINNQIYLATQKENHTFGFKKADYKDKILVSKNSKIIDKLAKSKELFLIGSKKINITSLGQLLDLPFDYETEYDYLNIYNEPFFQIPNEFNYLNLQITYLANKKMTTYTKTHKSN